MTTLIEIKKKVIEVKKVVPSAWKLNTGTGKEEVQSKGEDGPIGQTQLKVTREDGHDELYSLESGSTFIHDENTGWIKIVGKGKDLTPC